MIILKSGFSVKVMNLKIKKKNQYSFKLMICLNCCLIHITSTLCMICLSVTLSFRYWTLSTNINSLFSGLIKSVHIYWNIFHFKVVLSCRLTDLERKLLHGPAGLIRPITTRGMPPPGNKCWLKNDTYPLFIFSS